MKGHTAHCSQGFQSLIESIAAYQLLSSYFPTVNCLQAASTLFPLVSQRRDDLPIPFRTAQLLLMLQWGLKTHLFKKHVTSSTALCYSHYPPITTSVYWYAAYFLFLRVIYLLHPTKECFSTKKRWCLGACSNNSNAKDVHFKSLKLRQKHVTIFTHNTHTIIYNYNLTVTKEILHNKHRKN